MAKEEKSRKPGSFRDAQEEIAFLRQKCSSLSMRGHYAECIKTIEDNLSLFYTGERWPESFFGILRLYQKCYPSLNKPQHIDEYLIPILKRNGIPFVLAGLLRGGDSAIEWRADFFKERAAACRGEEKLEEALAYIDLVLKIDPRSSSAHVMRGWYLEELGKDGEALKAYEEALELNPGNKHALNSVAKHYIKHNPKQALGYIEKAIRESPDEPIYYASKAEILKIMGNRDAAMAAIDQAIDNDPYNPEYPYQKAELYLEDGKEGAALPQYRIAVALNEKHLPSLTRLAELTKQQQPELALSYITAVVAMQPENRDAMLARAKLQHRLGEHTAAIQQYTDLLERDPDCVEALGGLGALYLAGGQTEQAVEALARATALDPQNARYHFDKGRAHRQLGQDGDAIREYKAATSEDKSLAQAWAELGHLHAQSQPREAVEYFSKAIRLDPENASCHAAKARILMELPGELNASIESLNLACRYDPGNSELHYKLARHLERVENYASAVEHLKQAVRLNPKNDEAFYHLARLQYETHPELALLYINSAVGLRMTSGLYLYYKGKIFVALEENPQAREDLWAALPEQEPAGEDADEQPVDEKSADERENLAEIAALLAGGSLQLALLYFNRAIELEPENAAFLCARAHLLCRTGQIVKAQDQYERLLKKNADQHEALFGVAQILASKKDKKALHYFDSAINQAPAVAEYHAGKAAFLAENDESYKQALEEYATAISLNKQAWRVILEMAQLLERRGELSSAVVEYRHVLMVYRKATLAAARLGILLADFRPDHALIYLNQAVKLDRDNLAHYAWRSRALFALGREEAAEADLRAAVDCGGGEPETYFAIATILAGCRPEIALDYTRKALEAMPGNPEILMLCGRLHFEIKDYAPARAYFQKAAALNAANHEARERLAEIAFLTGNPEANSIAAEAHESKPECLFCTFLKARILDEREGDTASALRFMTRVVELAPEVLEYREKLVALLAKKRSFLKLAIEKRRLEKLRKRLAEPLEVLPPPEFESEEEKAASSAAGPSPVPTEPSPVPTEPSPAPTGPEYAGSELTS